MGYDPNLQQDMKTTLEELRRGLDMLHRIPSPYNRSFVLNDLRDCVDRLETLFIKQERSLYRPEEDTQTFTLQQLANYDGKNGKPAYVAVNGRIYDVTNNGAWAAATHFGLTAGKDLTSDFASCHKGQHKLGKLPIVGRLV